MIALPHSSLEIAELETERLPLSEVEPHPDNPRIHTPEQIEEIKKSLLEHGYAAGSMTVQRSRMRLVKGHGVYEALLALGCIQADFVVKDMTDQEALIFLVRDNRMGDLSHDDPPRLKMISVQLQEMNVEIERIGYTLKEIDAMQPRKAITEDEPPAVSEEKPVTQIGDLWILGKHRVLCGDSTKAEDVERVMDGEKADCVISSPPYPGASMWTEDGESPEEQISRLNELCFSVLKLCWDNINDNCVACWNIADVPYGNHGMIATTTTTTTKQACEDIGFSIRGQIIWDKAVSHLAPPCFLRRPTVPNLTHEFILILFKGDWIPREQKSGLSDIDKSILARSVWQIDTESAKAIGHIAPYPVELPSRCVRLFSLEDETIYDPFLGSGTTLIAADQLDRICYGIEIAPKYVDVIIKRYMNHSRFGSAGVSVERNGKTLTWEQAERKSKLPKVI